MRSLSITPALALAAALLLSLLGISSEAGAQSAPTHYLSVTTSTNSKLINGARSIMHSLVAVNTTTTVYYLKFYNKATAPTCNTDAVQWTVPLPPTATGTPGAPIQLAGLDLQFSLGLGLCITGGIADNDNTNSAAGIAVSIGAAGY